MQAKEICFREQCLHLNPAALSNNLLKWLLHLMQESALKIPSGFEIETVLR